MYYGQTMPEGEIENAFSSYTKAESELEDQSFLLHIKLI